MPSARRLWATIGDPSVYALFHRPSMVRVGVVCGCCAIVFCMMMVVCVMRVRLVVVGVRKSGKRKKRELWMNVRKVSTRVIVVEGADLWQGKRPHESRKQDEHKTAVPHSAPFSFAFCYLRVQTLMWMLADSIVL